MSDPAIFDLILAAEIGAARLEAALDADPRIAQQWRAEVGLAEAVASVGLEDVRLSAPGLLERLVRNRIGELETSAAEDALAILRFIKAPLGASEEPGAAMARIMRFCPSPAPGDPPWPDPDEMAAVFDHCRGRSPILEAMRASGAFGLLTDRRSPIAERLVFMTAEHIARGRGAHASRPRKDDPLRGLGGRYDAGWIVPPAMSLISARFRIWSPAGAGHARALIEGVSRQLGREIGRIGTIRNWVNEADRIARARHGRSRIHDAIGAFMVEPLLNVAQLADRISVTQRGALNLMETMRGHGLVSELTRRRSVRYWATPGLASLLAITDVHSMPGRHGVTSARTAAGGFGPQAQNAAQLMPAENAAMSRTAYSKAEAEAAMERAMAEFDRALEEADTILARIPRK